MTEKGKIRNIIELFIAWNGETEAIDVANLDSAVDFIADSLQKEPATPKVLEDMLNAKTAAESLGISQEEHDRIVDELIYCKEPELVDDFPNKEEEPVSEELHIVIDNEVKKIWDEINTGHDYCIIDSYNQFYGICIQIAERAKKEPVSEELEKAAVEWFNSVKYKSDLSGTPIEGFKAGAQWQKEVFEKNRLAACDAQTEEEAEIEQSFVMGIIENEHRQPTFDDAIKYGMRLQKKKMMEEAIDVEVKVDAGGYPYVDKTIELYDYDKDIPLAKMGDKYKVVLIKED